MTNYLARVNYTGLDGATDTFEVPFPYIDKANVAFRINGAEPDTITWNFANQVTLTPMPPAGSYVYIIRRTAIIQNQSVFAGGNIASKDLNNDFLQLLYLCQEFLDDWYEHGEQITYLNVRAIFLPEGTGGKFVQAISARRNNLFIWDSDGNPTSISLAGLSELLAPDLQLGFFTNVGDGAVPRLLRQKLLETIAPEDYGAVGDGVADDTAAFTAMWAAIQSSNGGRIVNFRPGANYVWNFAGLGNGVAKWILTDIFGLTINFNGALITLPRNYYTELTDVTNYALTFRNSANIFVYGWRSNAAAYVTPDDVITGGTTFSRGVSVLNFEKGCRKICIDGWYQVGGRTGPWFFGIQLDTDSTSDYCSQVIIKNAQFDRVFYPVTLHDTEDALVDIKTEQVGRSIFARCVKRLNARVESHNNYADDVIFVNQRYTTVVPRPIIRDVKLQYVARTPRTNPTYGGAFVTVAMRTSGVTLTGGCLLENVDIEFDVDQGGGGNTNMAFDIVRQYDALNNGNILYDTGAARGHEVYNLKLRGRVTGTPAATSIFNLFNTVFGGSVWPAGETVKGLTLQDLVVTGDATAFISLDGTCMDTPVVFRDISLAGVFQLSNLAGEKFLTYNVASANFNTFATVVPTWTADAGAQPALGNGSLNAQVERIGCRQFVKLALNMGSTTTYGSASDAWAFTLPAPYNTNADMTAVGAAYGLDNSVAYRVGTAKIDDNDNKIRILSEGIGAPWRSNVPHAWGNGDLLALSLDYKTK